MNVAFGLRTLRLGQLCRSPIRTARLHPATQSRTASAVAMPKRKRSAATVEETVTVTAVEVVVEDPPRRRSARKPKVVSYAETESTTRVVFGKEGSPLTELSDEEQPKVAPKKRRRRKKTDEPVVYDIPPVERKHTTFKGRLGYACLNTILRVSKPDPIFCSRTCRLETIRKNGLDFAKNLGLQNCRDLCKLIEWNEENNIKFLRISSEMFPFASHLQYGYDLEYAKDELKKAGDLAKRLGHRLTTHPGQFTQLASPKEAVVDASVRELEYHCQMMRYMGLGKDSVIIIHMGGVYGDKPTTLERFKENYRTKLTDEMKARLVLENDEMCYNADELLPVCNELDIPIVFDYHHNWINPSVHPLSTLIPMINATWLRKGIKPKQHLSSPRPGCENGSVMEKRAHSDRCYTLPDELVLPPLEGEPEGTEVDLMIEAKDKEQAVFLLYRIYGLAPVKHENLRPEEPQKTAARLDEDEDKAVLADVAAGEDRDGNEITEAPGSENKASDFEHAMGSDDEIKKRRRGKQDTSAPNIASLVNQEDAPMPVDESTGDSVEAQEHPEAVAAAVLDGDGCGVKKSRGRKKDKKSKT